MGVMRPTADKSNKSRAMAFTIGALACSWSCFYILAFRYYPEKRAAEHFFDALVAGDTATAYNCGNRVAATA